MTRIGPGRCQRCRAPVIWLPVLGALLDVEPRAYTADQVPDADRLVVLPDRADDPTETTPGLVLRRHRCPIDQPGEASPPPSRPTPPPAAPATHADYQLLNRLRTRAELLRAQALGKLREHPGSRRHSPMVVPGRAVEALALTSDRCLLCPQPLTGDSAIVVAEVEGSPGQTLRVHWPECPRRPQAAGAPDGPGRADRGHPGLSSPES